MESALLDDFALGDAREREESWRYSRAALRALAQQDFIPANTLAPLPPSLLARFQWDYTRGRRIVFVNGAYTPEYSDVNDVRPDIEFQHEPENRFILTIPAGRTEPLHLVYANVPGLAASRWQASSSIHLLGGSIQLIEHHLGEPGVDVLGALNSQITASTKSDLQVCTISDLPDSASLYRRVRASVENVATLRTAHAIFGGRLQRFDLDVDLTGTQAGFVSRGLFALRARQHADIHLDVCHGARDTRSDIIWRGVADQRSRGVFHGAITVEAGADGADAKLGNKNLLLSPLAEIDTQPVLEIHTDEVKAAHGATVGQLDHDALFYLRSRGLDLDAARRVLISAFCHAVMEGIPQGALHEHIDALLDARLRLTGIPR